MKAIKTVSAMVHSVGGPIDGVEIIAENGNNKVLARYKGVYCTAIFNPFVCMYYADDMYGRLTEEQAKQYYNEIIR